VLVPKSQLKVLHGPFRGEVSLTTGYLTLFVDKYYAGRFPASFGKEPLPAPGHYTVRDKSEGRDYYRAGDGRTIAANNQANPYGGHWIDLGSEICIHGSPAQRDVSPDYGCISLAPADAQDVYGILSLGSSMTIKR
jgi:lipoprotein-anchoring transpeptidase ErfK/SrfK